MPVKRNRTSLNGSKTQSRASHSALSIQGKDPDYDYAFRSRKEIEENGGEDIYGWKPIGEGNSSGESMSNYPGQKRTAGKDQMNYMDTVACRRKKEVSKYFKDLETQKYNDQVSHVRNSSARAQAAFRKLSADSKVRTTQNFRGPGMTQKTGPTIEGELNDG